MLGFHKVLEVSSGLSLSWDPLSAKEAAGSVRARAVTGSKRIPGPKYPLSSHGT